MSARQTRSQTHKAQQEQREQEQSLDKDTAADLNPAQPQASNPSILFIFLNDFTDADNEAAALVWARALELNPHIKGIYIAEPRHVNLGYYMNASDFGRCITLVNKLSPRADDNISAVRIVLGGWVLNDEYINRPDLTVDGRELTKEERDLLRRCIRPNNGDREDAAQHTRLLAMDYLTTMKAWCSRSFKAYLDVACLSELESPINLKTHYHEELVARTAEEMKEFQDITRLPTDDKSEIEDRRLKLRNWYERALARKEEDFGGKCPVEELKDFSDYEKEIFNEIENHDRTIFFGGASLTLLNHLIEKKPALAKKVEYYQQGGTFDSKLNILGNPLNFALNMKAARNVFNETNRAKVGKLVLIPTTTTQRLQFTAKGLTELNPAVGVRAVGFFGRLDPWALKSPREEEEGASRKTEEFLSLRAEWARDTFCADDTFRGKQAVMADLVAFLICFSRVFDEYKGKEGTVQKDPLRVSMTETKDGLVLKEDETSPILSMELKDRESPKTLLVDDVTSLVEKAMKTFYIP